METSIFDLTTLRLMPTGRRRFAISRLKEVANPDTEPQLLELCDEALAHDAETAELQAKRRQTQRRAQSGAARLTSAVALDHQIDRTLSAIDDKIASELEAHDEGSPERAELEDLRTTIFPQGVGAIARSAHVIAVERVRGVIERAGKHQVVLDAVGATKLMNRLKDLNGRFEAALKTDAPDVTGDDVRAATTKGNRLLRSIVVHILDQTRDEDDASVMEQRQRLLRPILEQDTVMFRYNRQKRKPTDVDPASGEEVPAEEGE